LLKGVRKKNRLKGRQDGPLDVSDIFTKKVAKDKKKYKKWQARYCFVLSKGLF